MNTPRHLTELALNRVLMGERDDALDDARAHLATCEACAAALERIREADASFRASALARPSFLTRRATITPLRPPRRAMGGVLAAAAALLFVVGLLSGGVDAPSAIEPSLASRGDGIRVKGAPLHVELYIHDGASVRRARSGERVSPGDRLGFELNVLEPGHVMIVGVDGAGEVYPCFPLEGERTRAFETSVMKLRPEHSMRLDATPGQERIVALHCEEPQNFEDIQRRLEQMYHSGGGVPSFEGCELQSWSLLKE